MALPALRRELAPSGPIGRLDRAVTLVRAAGLRAYLRAASAGAPLAVILVALYYVERVEGVRALRLPFAIAIVIAWGWRAMRLGRAARDHARALWEAVPIPDDAGGIVATLRTAAIPALGLWAWGWVIAGASYGGPLAVIAIVPLFAIRGAIAPSWIARAACAPEAGLGAMRRAIGDSRGQRFEGLVAELGLLVGALALFVDLWLAIAAALFLGRSFLGIDLALLDQFLSPRNTFVLLAVGMATLLALDPVRAALSAITWIEARVREEGLDLRIAIDEAIARSAPRRTALAAVVALALAVPGLARAQDPQPSDAVARERAAEILARPEFRELEDLDGRGVRQLIERLIEWLFRHRDPVELPDAPSMPSIALPGPLVFLALACLVLAALIGIAAATRPRGRRTRLPAAIEAGAPPPFDPRDRAPEEWAADAASLAERGLFRDALRALYLATLVALDRRRVIRFDPTLTNGQYAQQIADPDARRALRELSRAFEHAWYGREDVGEGDYRSARRIADQLRGEGA